MPSDPLIKLMLKAQGTVGDVAKTVKVDPAAIAPDSTGARKWVWTDHGEVKISARIWGRLLPVLAVAAILGFAAAITLALSKAPIALWQQASFGLAGVVLGSFALLTVYNRIVRTVRPKPAVPADGPPVESGDDGTPAGTAPGEDA